MKFYSWKDLDRFFQLNRNEWRGKIEDIEVYPSSITIYSNNETKAADLVSKLLPSNLDSDRKSVKLDIGGQVIPIVYEKADDSKKTEIAPVPLFRDILYRQSSYPKNIQPAELKCRVIAFHSYKGGVGRTLSLLAFAKAWATSFEDGDNKLLIIDADIEAPGLTWLYKEETNDIFSYLDLLTLIQDNDDIDEIVDLACAKIGNLTTISTPTDRKIIEHIFLPTYRYKEQFLDIYANPETIINGKDKGYVLANVLSKIGEKLNVAAVLVDLRTGISEFSSTLLFDARVKKYLVTTTSSQSIKGTKLILEYLLKGLEMNDDTI
ncbi:MAG: hypothetical protein LBR56_04800, partial [Sporomusaceae bacterium]|nr:hypothetical protein [Sporomusaceae bacterium]